MGKPIRTPFLHLQPTMLHKTTPLHQKPKSRIALPAKREANKYSYISPNLPIVCFFFTG